MRDRFRRLPSPSMAVAFIALLAALGGTAVALPGTGTVNSGDIRNSTIRTQDIKNNSGVRTQDIRNSTIQGRDVRNNTLRGPDINEASLGIVPAATNANTATNAINANNANTANFAGSAGQVNGRTLTGQARQADGGGDVTLVNASGFRIYAVCDFGALGAEIRMENTSTGGDEAHVVANWVGDPAATIIDEDDLDQGDSVTLVASNDADDSAIANFSAHGEDGTVVHGEAMATDGPDGNFPSSTDCASSVEANYN